MSFSGFSDYLFDTPSFLTGVARSLDLFGVYSDYNTSLSPETNDAIATLCDWLTVLEVDDLDIRITQND